MAYLGKTPSQAVRSRYYFTASGSETSLSPSEVTGLSFTDANYVDVSLNGVALVSGTDYTATPSTNTISGLAALTASDVVEIVVYDTFSVFGGSVKGDFDISNGTLSAEAVTVTSLTTSGNITFGDNDKAVFGADSDMSLFHNGNNAFLDNDTGTLFIQTDALSVKNAAGTESLMLGAADGAVTLYHNNAAKLATTSTGIDVTGTVTADGLTVEGDATVSSANPRIRLFETDTTDLNTQLQNNGGEFVLKTLLDDASNSTTRIKVAHSTGDISFYADNGTTQGLFWDASTQRLGLATTSPDTMLHLKNTTANDGPVIRLEGSGQNAPNQLIGGVEWENTDTSGDGPTVTSAIRNYSANALGSGGYLTFSTHDGTEGGEGSDAVERLRIDSNGRLLVGTTDTALYNNTSGNGFIYDAATGSTQMLRAGGTTILANRATNDGKIIGILQNGTEEGNISVSGTTVSYNGGHLARWSQLTDGTKDLTIVKGTVMTNLDQMAVWTHAATDDEEEWTEDNEQLNCMAVSSVEGDANVAGVFVNWDDDDDGFNDMNVAMTGDMVIRIASGTTVARGDLLMSAGDGTAKPQDDDIVRSKTIAKVTSTTVSHTYDDGSYLVPCVLMAC